MSDTPVLLKVLDAGLARGGLQAEDVLALVLPLFREVAALHERERVAGLDGPHAVVQAETGGLALARPEGMAPHSNRGAVERLQAPVSSVLHVVGETRVTQDDATGLAIEDLAVARSADAGSLQRPAYLPGYVAWERALGHHDAVTDILCLGQVLASLACGLDFASEEDLRTFARERANLFRLHPRLHPVIGSVILEMTEKEVASTERVALLSWLRFEDQPYLPGALDRIIQEDRRDRAEYGFSQLSLVVAFLRWHNLKEDRNERIVSPLLLLPVELTRRKGVRDQYVLQADSPVAAVNPVLRQQLRLVYGIELPESLDLGDGSIAAFHQMLQARIAGSEPGVQLRLLREPHIELIHQRARQRLEQFRRRRPVNAPRQPAGVITDYSYAADDFRPLGLKLFHERVLPAPLPLRGAVGAAVAPRQPQMAAQEVEHTTFALREIEGNPYQWDVDLTTVTLGNFNYRKMSLVRDYNALVDGDLPNAAFDRVFSVTPRKVDAQPAPTLPLADQWGVVTADATQIAAVALARGGDSYIIQGPPGTGKSQTITNLIADYVGRGKRVLFVCEKRAAIDVVFHRLRQQGLDELCCMIHDSQADKKSFVLNLKQTYEQWLATQDEFDELQRQRANTVDALLQDLGALQRFDAAMRSAPPGAGLRVRALLHRLVALRAHAQPVDPRAAEALPAYETWLAHGGLAERLQQVLQETLGISSLAQHVFARLGDGVVRHDRPLARLAELTDAAEPLVEHCAEVLEQAWPDAPPLTWGEAQALVAHARDLRLLAERGQLALLDASSAGSRELEKTLAQLNGLQQAHAAARAKTTHWRDKLVAAEAQAALAQARSQEGSVLRWLQPAWWRLRGLVRARYDFAAHVARPALVLVLTELVAEHEAAGRLEEARQALAASHGATSPEEYGQMLESLRGSGRGQPAVAAFHQLLLQQPGAAAVVRELAGIGEEMVALRPLLADLLADAQGCPLRELAETIRDLREQGDSLPDLLPLLRELGEADPAFAQALRRLVLPASSIEHAIARESLERLYRSERWLPRFDAAALARHAERLAAGERRLLELNARTVRAAVRRRFAENARRSMLAASQLDEAGKQFKKAYSAGRRELEHEFGKSMRFKAIRELASGDSGQVVRAMKPVWLMSPLSVSDTLPLAADLFDVVVFDEASQITVEEAVPALYRAPQVIIVGDEMQLPPTSFFSAGRDVDGDTVEVTEEGERMSVVLDADSLLNQGARNLPATLLAWHYRSRSESLIGFSNAAFYAGNLYTIPDRSVAAGDGRDLVVQGTPGAEVIAANTDALLARSISFHTLPTAVYQSRRNEAEAAYIAQLVRELLARNTRRSIGIVAFSEAQQSEIEEALSALAASDEVFATRLEAEYVREEDDQFCGLFVKNLENVQGDERDVIILSVCYGPGPEGRMLMNFGPINQRGGEKRLNVIFSRARHHMAVVSSIRHEAITNDYNDGAAALKQFLRYAEHVSRGQRDMAQRVLEGLNPATRKALTAHLSQDEVVAQLAAALRERGHQIDEQVGQSRFRCDLAVRDGDACSYRLGVLVDTDTHYANPDVLELYVSRPRILDSFGWRVVQVLSRDWLHQPHVVIDRIERALRGEALNEPDARHPAEEVAAQPAEALQAARQQDQLPVGPAAGQPASVPAASAQALAVRHFECVEGNARKFWRIQQDGACVTISFGRLGTRGQAQVKEFASGERAAREVAKLVAEKVRKGYLEAKP